MNQAAPRVCFVANGNTPHGVTRAEALGRAGNDVHFVTIGPTLETPVPMHTSSLPGGPIAAVSGFFRFFRDIRSLKPDLLHLHYAGGRLGTLAHLACVHPFVVSVIGGDVLAEQHEGGLPPRERFATEAILRDADLVLAKSQRLRHRLLEMGVASDRIEIVKWGVDASVFTRDDEGRARIRARFGCGEDHRVILSPRSLQPLYNIDLVIAAFGEAANADPSLRLALTETGADNTYVAALRTQIATLGIGERVQWWGRFERAELPALYSAADVVVNVPRSDGLPQSLFEAMACEAPTFLGDLPGYRELAAEGEGVRYVGFDAPTITRALLTMTREQGRALGAAGRKRILEVADINAEARRVSEFYRRLMGAPRRKRAPSFSEAWSLVPRSM